MLTRRTRHLRVTPPTPYANFAIEPAVIQYTSAHVQSLLRSPCAPLAPPHAPHAVPTLPARAALTSPLLECGQLGIATECLTWVRRHKIGPSKYLHARPKAFKLSMSLAFSVQVTLGYFLMLAAMTYQGEIFIAVIVGLGVGHLAFNVSQPIGESTDACCVELVLGVASECSVHLHCC